MTDVWYISARATREYLALTGRQDDDGGPEWQRAESDLQEIGRRATASQAGKPSRNSADTVTYRGPKPLRLGLLVSRAPRPEGPLPQLISVHAGNAVARHGEVRPRSGNDRRTAGDGKRLDFNGAASEVRGTVQRAAPVEQAESTGLKAITRTPAICGGQACVRGTRVPVSTLLRLVMHHTPVQAAEQVGLKPHQVVAALEYAARLCEEEP